MNSYEYVRAVENGVRAPTWTPSANGLPTATFSPPLTAQEQAIFDDITTMAKLGLTNDLTLAEFRAIKPDLATAKAFVGIASPTAAQSNAALKATIRILGALLRQ